VIELNNFIIDKNIINILINIIKKDEVLIRSIYYDVNKVFGRIGIKEIDNYRKEIIKDITKNKEKSQFLDYFPILKLINKNNLDNFDTQIFNINDSNQHIAISNFKKINTKIHRKREEADFIIPFDLGLGLLANTSDWNGFYKMVPYLNENQGIIKLINSLGQTSLIRHLSGKQTINVDAIIQEKQELHSYILSNDPTLAIPSELYFFFAKEFELVFLVKMLESQLISKRYKAIENVKLRTNRANKIGEHKLGSIIICLDTSGSMRGIKELISKAFCAQIIERARKDLRHVFIINFSIKTEIIYFDPTESKRENLKNMQIFLNKLFNSGTDITNVIDALEKLTIVNQFRFTDVIMVSDFIFKKPLSDLKSQWIDDFKKKNNYFIAFNLDQKFKISNTIGKLFDEQYRYLYQWNGNEVNDKEVYQKIINYKPGKRFPLMGIFKKVA